MKIAVMYKNSVRIGNLFNLNKEGLGEVKEGDMAVPVAAKVCPGEQMVFIDETGDHTVIFDVVSCDKTSDWIGGMPADWCFVHNRQDWKMV